MGVDFYFEWEIKLMEFLQSFMNPVMVKLNEIISFFGTEYFMVLFAGYVYWVYNKKEGLRVGMNILLSNLIFSTAKNIALRRRPYMSTDRIKCFSLVDKSADAMDITAQGYSFPSGHSATIADIGASAVQVFNKKAVKIAATVLTVLVGISRCALGAHYPTDVLAGWAIGLICAFGLPWLRTKVKSERKLYFGICAVSCLGIFVCKSNDFYSAFGTIVGFLLGNLFDEKYVKFENTKNVWAGILRVLGGAAIFFGLNTLLKLPFSEEFLASATAGQFAVRFFRYAIIIFIEMGVYPMCFGKIIKKK